jgi:hypothetical protein
MSDQIRWLRDEMRWERHRIDLILDFALFATMVGVALVILVIGLAR